jgi:acyl-CoA thioester hydrolase
MSATPLVPDATLLPPPDSAIAHSRPFGLRLVPSADGVSRAIAHINNVEYVRWIDRAAELHADSLGHTREQLLESGRMWFVARHEVDYRAEVFPGDELHVFTWIRSVGRAASWRDTVILRARDGATVCRATTCWAFVDLVTRKPARIPTDMLFAFQPLEAGCTSRSSLTRNDS